MIVDALLQAGVGDVPETGHRPLVADPACLSASGWRCSPDRRRSGILFFPVAFAGHVLASLLVYRLVVRFRTELYSHLQKLSLGFFQQTQVGEVATRLTADIDIGVNGLVRYVSDGSWSGTMVVVSLGGMLFLSWKLALIFVALTAVYLAASHVFLRGSGDVSRVVRDQSGDFNAQLTEDVSAIALVKAFARERWFFERFPQRRRPGSTARRCAPRSSARPTPIFSP